VGRAERDGVTSAGGHGDAADGSLEEVLRLERLLLDRAVRSEGGRLEALLHPDFLEHGASGRVWDRDAVVKALPADPGVSGVAFGFLPVRLSDDVVLLTYRIDGPRPTLRSSVWVRDESSGWRLRFHQGTRVPDAS